MVHFWVSFPQVWNFYRQHSSFQFTIANVFRWTACTSTDSSESWEFKERHKQTNWWEDKSLQYFWAPHLTQWIGCPIGIGEMGCRWPASPFRSGTDHGKPFESTLKEPSGFVSCNRDDCQVERSSQYRYPNLLLKSTACHHQRGIFVNHSKFASASS
jgi:hypothetical protein